MIFQCNKPNQKKKNKNDSETRVLKEEENINEDNSVKKIEKIETDNDSNEPFAAKEKTDTKLKLPATCQK